MDCVARRVIDIKHIVLPQNKNLHNLSKNLRTYQTPWKRHLWYDFLRTYPVQFNRQKIIGNYIVDFYCRKANLVIELDGGGHYTPEQQEYDKNRTQYLQSQNLNVLRFTNLDIHNNFYEVCTQIDIIVKSQLAQSSVTS